jgi:N-acetyl-anhydromuramoyl-L-alanine amidase
MNDGQFRNGWYVHARRVDSPNFDARPVDSKVDLVVLHHISLPAGRFGGDAVERLFTNRISPNDPELGELATLRVSAHFFITREGETVQFVSLVDRAWHAGVSSWRGRERVNDFSIGIELEGDSEHAFTEVQYRSLNTLLREINRTPHGIALTTHAEIAFGRKVDPGPKLDFMSIELGRSANVP